MVILIGIVRNMLFFLQIVLPPLGSHHKTWDRYRQNVDLARNQFTCFDGSKVIPLSSFNDRVIDCPDGSDEPSTGVVPNTTFYCPNRLIQPLKLDWKKVGDGVCDCCDGSDEAMNPDVTCPENCSSLEFQRHDFADTMMAKMRRGIRVRKVMERRAQAVLSDAKARAWKTATQRRLYNWFSSFVELKYSDVKAAKIPEGLLADLWRMTFRPRRARAPFSTVFKNAVVYDFISWNRSIADNEQFVKFMDDVRETFPAAAIWYGKKYDIRDKPWKLFLGMDLISDDETIGYYDHMEGDTMYYVNGDECDGPERTKHAELKLICNDEMRLVTVQQETACLYKGIFAVPFICNSTHDVPLYGMRLPKLRQMICDVGLLRCYS